MFRRKRSGASGHPWYLVMPLPGPGRYDYARLMAMGRSGDWRMKVRAAIQVLAADGADTDADGMLLAGLMEAPVGDRREIIDQVTSMLRHGGMDGPTANFVSALEHLRP